MKNIKKIKILYTIPNFDTAGSGIALYKILANIDKNKFEPEVACLHDKGELFLKVKELGIPIHILLFCHQMRPLLKGIWHSWKFSRFLIKKRFDIIYSYHYSADYSEPIAALFANIPWIYVKKNMAWFGPNLRAWKLRSLLATGIIAQNKDMITYFFRNSKKVKLIPIGVDLDEFKYRKRININEANKVNLVSVSNIIPIKGIDNILFSLKLLEVEYKFNDYIFNIVGYNESEYGKYLQKIANELNLLGEIKFTGRMNNVAEFLLTQDIFIQASTKQGEGSPIALQEAMASGLIVLGSNVSGIRDQLGEFPELLFTWDNNFELASKINDIIEMSHLKKNELRSQLYDSVVKNYSLQREIEEHQKYLEKILGD